MLFSEIFDAEVRVRFLLEELGFSEQQTLGIRDDYLDQTIDAILDSIRTYLR